MKSKYAKELKKIAQDHGGILYPEDVVNSARDPKSPLHDVFEWDDGIAAEQYRLEQARRLIRVQVIIEPRKHKMIRAYISLTPARVQEGGYTPIQTIMSNKKLYEQMKADAARELEVFNQKYARIEELNPVFEAAEKFIIKVKKKG